MLAFWLKDFWKVFTTMWKVYDGGKKLKNSEKKFEKIVWQGPEYASESYCRDLTQPEFTCSSLTIEKLEQGIKYVQS